MKQTLMDLVKTSGNYQHTNREYFTPTFIEEKFVDQIKNGDVVMLLKNVFLFSNNLAVNWVKETESSKGVINVCAKGCSSCCTQPILINQLEKMLILDWVNENFATEEKNELKKKLKLIQTKVKQLKRPRIMDEFGIKKYRKAYNDLKVACLFLNEQDQTCTIYDVRPMSCKTYFEYQSAQKCEDMIDSDTSVSFDDAEFTIMYILKNAIFAFAKYHNVDPNTIIMRYLNAADLKEIPNALTISDFK